MGNSAITNLTLGGGVGASTGTIAAMAACDTPPSGWLPCDGSTVAKASYTDLFNKIGQKYGLAATTSTIPNVGVSKACWDGTNFWTAGMIAGSSYFNGGQMLSSTDGINWKVRNSFYTPGYFTLTGCAYGNSTLVFVGGAIESPTAYATAYVSTDGGNTWRSVYINGQNYGVCRAVIYANSMFVAIWDNGHASAWNTATNCKIFTSTDGITWTERYTGTGQGGMHDIAYGGGNFAVVGQTSSGSVTKAWYSSNGTSWSASTITGTKILYSVAYGASKFIAMPGPGLQPMYSSNGSSWTDCGANSVVPNSVNPLSLSYFNSKFVYVGSNSSTGGFYASHTDPSANTAWTTGSISNFRIDSASHCAPWGLVSNGTTLIALVSHQTPSYSVMYTGGGVVTTTDATTWSNAGYYGYGTSAHYPRPTSFKYLNGKYYALTERYARNGSPVVKCPSIFESSDLITWRGYGAYISGTRYSISDMTWDGTNFVAVCSGDITGTSYAISTTSLTATDWTSRASQATSAWSMIEYGNSMFLIANMPYGSGSDIYKMTTAWSVSLARGTVFLYDGSGYTLSASEMRFVYDRFFITAIYSAGSPGLLLSTTDGISFTLSQIGKSGSSNSSYGLKLPVYLNGKFVTCFVGNGANATGQTMPMGTIYTSSDGTNWTNTFETMNPDTLAIAGNNVYSYFGVPFPGPLTCSGSMIVAMGIGGGLTGSSYTSPRYLFASTNGKDWVSVPNRSVAVIRPETWSVYLSACPQVYGTKHVFLSYVSNSISENNLIILDYDYVTSTHFKLPDLGGYAADMGMKYYIKT